MISESNKFIFIHIPKTGGSSVSYALKEYAKEKIEMANSRVGKGRGVSVVNDKRVNVKHLKLYGILRMNPEYKHYLSFTIVRNPYDRMMSYYFWNYGNKPFEREQFVKFIKRCNDFQYRYVTHPKTDKLLVKTILKFENLKQDLKKIPNLKVSSIPHLNSSINSKGKFYDNELKELVYEKFKKDFDFFGYIK